MGGSIRDVSYEGRFCIGAATQQRGVGRFGQQSAGRAPFFRALRLAVPRSAPCDAESGQHIATRYDMGESPRRCTHRRREQARPSQTNGAKGRDQRQAAEVVAARGTRATVMVSGGSTAEPRSICE